LTYFADLPFSHLTNLYQPSLIFELWEPLSSRDASILPITMIAAKSHSHRTPIS
jgi:hypothetical protein